ncbi:hypothetical protein ACIBKY_26870 [Nonomuraea sp. NPDC050394]|uniref:hypothetical protein n=1 Tax=Nonomuraea sp. NPDC050394 TaxID=3364363 RepID=UPI0037B04987
MPPAAPAPAAQEPNTQPPASPPGRIWAIGVLVLSAAVSMSMNTWHALTATRLPVALAVLYGVAPVALAAMQSHAVALRALRREKVGTFRRLLTFGLVLGGLGLSFLGIYDLLRHAVPDPIPAVPLHEPAVFFSIVLDVMALAALHELLRESPAFATAALATIPAVPARVEQSPTRESEGGTETTSTVGTVVSIPGSGTAADGAVPEPISGVPAQVAASPEDVDHSPVEDGQAVSGIDQVQPEIAADVDAPFRPVAVAQFLAEVAQGEPPSVRTIKDRMGVGTDRARRLQSYLGQLVEAAQ